MLTRVELFRRERGLTQRAVAKHLGINPTNLSALERGIRRSWPRVRRGLAEFYGVPEDVLFEKDGRLKMVKARDVK